MGNGLILCWHRKDNKLLTIIEITKVETVSMIKYVIQAKKNPLKKNEIKYYPQMAPTTPMSLAQIVKRVENVRPFQVLTLKPF